jgi:hypothetical protein
MTEVLLESCILICKFFDDQKVLNDEAIGLLADLAGFVKRLLPSLQSLDTRGLESAAGQLRHLWVCLQGCQRLYDKYKDGWQLRRFYVTPGQIRDKAKTQEERTRNSWLELSTHLNIAIHNNMQPSAPAGAVTKIDDPWELDSNSVRVDLNQYGDPMEHLGQGSFGVVGLGTLTRDHGIVMPVAVKMAMANKRAAATRQPAGKNIVDHFRREVRLLATMEHPNIVQCFGSITHRDGVCVMWIVMEKLDFTLFAAIKGRHLQIGRDDPRTYVDMVAGICSALSYLHTPVGGKPIVPENIMIKSLQERVVKLIDFDMAKETQAGVGSTMSTKGTKEYMAPEVHKNGGCSVASDMWALALVALFIFSGKSPSEISDIRKIEESPHPKANFTKELMSRCLNERPELRPAASFVSFNLDSYKEKTSATADIENTFYIENTHLENTLGQLQSQSQ